MSRVNLIREPPSPPAAPPPARRGRQRRTHPATEAPHTPLSAPPPPTAAQQLALDALSAAPEGLLLHELPHRVTIATMRVLLRQRRVAFADGRWTLVTIPPAGLNPSPGSLP